MSRLRASKGIAAFALLATLVQPARPGARADGELTDLNCHGVTANPTVAAAEDLLNNRYIFPGHTVAVLPSDPSWGEDPFHEDNWLFQFHSLFWTEDLWYAWTQTADKRFLDRYLFILQDWVADNPFTHPPSPFSWNNHSSALRGILYACAVRRLGPGFDWLNAAARVHIGVLSREDFYQHRGNHALDQSIALLDLSCALFETAGRDLAASRIETLVRQSIDYQGVTNEQSEVYQRYNYSRYSLALSRMEACGLVPSDTFRARVALMPNMLAWATQPDGATSMIGDTGDAHLSAIPGTDDEYAATEGRSGTKPSSLYAVYNGGYGFFRSGWGEHRAFKDETLITTRFGPGRIMHGHNDASAVTLYSQGARILQDSGGPFSYAKTDPRSRWVASEAAHNVVTADGRPMREKGSTTLLAHRHGPQFDFLRLVHWKMRGVRAERRVFYARDLDVLIVDDQMDADSALTFRQWWHVNRAAAPRVTAGGFDTGGAGATDTYVRQLVGAPHHTIVRGQTDPIQGWVSPSYLHLVPAPAVSATQRGRHVRFVTLIVPDIKYRGRGAVEHLGLSPDGFTMTFRLGGLVDEFTVRGSEVGSRRVA